MYASLWTSWKLMCEGKTSLEANMMKKKPGDVAMQYINSIINEQLLEPLDHLPSGITGKSSMTQARTS